jgi:hypothetical protein
MSRYRFIETQRSQYPVRLLCQVVAVPVSGYYAWQQMQEQAGSKKKPAWEEALVKVFGRHKRRYGTRRLQVALRRKGYHVGRQRLHRAMRRRGLHALQPKAFTPAPPIRPTGCAAPRTGYSTSPSRRKLTRSGSAISPICRWPTATGLICARTRTWSASVWWAGTSWPPCRRSWLRPPCSALSGPSRPHRTYWSTPTTAGSTAATGTASCSTTIKPWARRAAAATATIMRKLRVSGHASKRRCSKSANGPFLPTWPTPKPASPTILITTITSACTLVSTTRHRITLTNSFFNLTP